MRFTHLTTLFVVVVFSSRLLFGQQLFFQHYSEKDGLNAKVITSVEWSNDGLCVGSDAGIFKKTKTNRFKKIAITTGVERYITRLDNIADGRIWACNTSGQIFFVSGGNATEIDISQDLKKLLSESMIDQMESLNGQYYISAIIGGGIYRSRGNSYQIISDSLSKARFLLLELENGGLISGLSNVGQDNDELLVKFRNGKTLEFMLSEEHYHSKSVVTRLSDQRYVFSRGREIIIFNQNGVLERRFCDANVENILEDKEGKIWIGFAEGGLYCFPSGEFSSNNYSRYLSRNTIYDMALDDKGDLWFATSAGLFSLPKLEDAVYVAPVFSERNSSLETTVQVEAESNDTEKQELISPFVTTENPWPKATLSSVKINSRDTSLEEIYQLTYNQNFIELEFTGLINNRPEAVQFKYKLNGLDTNWTYTSGNKAVYQALNPGTYTFDVYAQSKMGSWSEVPANLTFIISDPFWKTRSFYLMIAVGVIFIGLLIILLLEQLKRRNRMREQEFKKQVLQSELQALRAQMNPHFTFNTLSSIQNYISRNDADNASKYLSKFAKLMRTIMENAKQTHVPLEDELAALALYLELESLRLREKFEYEIHVDPGIDQQYVSIPSMLIQPYVENAIWHGITNKEGKGHLKVEVVQNGSFLKCIVEDDGIGRKAAMKISERKRKHISHGMSITRDRLELMNSLNKSQLNVEIIDKVNAEDESAGTRVEIFIPIKDD